MLIAKQLQPGSDLWRSVTTLQQVRHYTSSSAPTHSLTAIPTPDGCSTRQRTVCLYPCRFVQRHARTLFVLSYPSTANMHVARMG
jgi:hypothetical protein